MRICLYVRCVYQLYSVNKFVVVDEPDIIRSIIQTRARSLVKLRESAVDRVG
jgi:hypothetical protein